ncbi:hypothetical protein RG963_06780 [Methanosarcina sp. Z-7115]|uniref:Uncharacterized protein n=1 Tax=Methanosarcina baikalica TaxID=3073890 RepID=A0ABU2D0W1_9EURY|nr:hypothetical protein [Methanosarcina sp. Z-7115]MDR7665487.1 hypothetical protein [Methanosarcina sp. Z-7115]
MKYIGTTEDGIDVFEEPDGTQRFFKPTNWTVLFWALFTCACFGALLLLHKYAYIIW